MDDRNLCLKRYQITLYSRLSVRYHRRWVLYLVSSVSCRYVLPILFCGLGFLIGRSVFDFAGE